MTNGTYMTQTCVLNKKFQGTKFGVSKKGFNDTLEDLSFSVSLKVSNDLRLPSHRHGMSELKN